MLILAVIVLGVLVLGLLKLILATIQQNVANTFVTSEQRRKLKEDFEGRP